MRMRILIRSLPLLVPILAMIVVACRPIESTRLPVVEENLPIVSSPAPTTTKTLSKIDDGLKSLTPSLSTEVSTRYPAIYTPQPTLTEQPGPGSVESPQDSEIDGRIYAWVAPGSYFSIKVPFYGHGVETSLPNVLGPNRAILPAFAPYSDRIAYLTIKGHPELWVADLDLTQVERIWIDETNWLGEIQSRDYLKLAWGPQDNSIILSNLAATPRTVVYNFTSKTVKRISGTCDQIGLPPIFQQLTLVCLDEASSSQLYLAGGGNQETFSSASGLLTTVVQNWSFSPDGNRVLYVTKQNDLMMSTVDGQHMNLPLTYNPPICCGIELMRDDLQWSQDGTRLLVYGKGPNAKNPRWYVLDATTGEPVWATSPKDVVRALENQLSAAFDMTLSPDGLWLVTSYFDMDEASRYTAIISLTTGQKIEISEGTVDLLKWVDRMGASK